MRTISLKLPDDLLEHLTREARAKGVTKSRIIRESVERALRPQSPADVGSCYELARDLAGSVKGLPHDLANNPAYLEEFGQ